MRRVWVYRTQYGSLGVVISTQTKTLSLYLSEREAGEVLRGLDKVLDGDDQYEINIDD